MNGGLPNSEWPVTLGTSSPLQQSERDRSDVLFLLSVPFLIAALPRDSSFLKITLDNILVLCTRVLQVSVLTAVNIFLGFGCEASVSVVSVFPGHFI